MSHSDFRTNSGFAIMSERFDFEMCVHKLDSRLASTVTEITPSTNTPRPWSTTVERDNLEYSGAVKLPF